MLDASARSHVATRISEGRPRVPAASADGSVRVHSAYRSVLNVSTPDGLLTIASGALGALPNGIVADLGPDLRSLGIRAGQAVEADERTVRIAEIDLRLDLSRAVAWSPRMPLPADGATRAAERWRTRSSSTRASARRLARPGGMAALLGSGSGAERGSALDVTERVRPILTALASALAEGDRTAAAERALGLIGLGPGLTPSGDDVLVGIEAALHALGRPTAGFVGGALDGIDERTTTIGATFLRHAARGEFAERLHALLEALLGPDEGAVPGAIQRAIAWGATSGTDGVVGVLCGLDVAAGLHERLDR